MCDWCERLDIENFFLMYFLGERYVLFQCRQFGWNVLFDVDSCAVCYSMGCYRYSKLWFVLFKKITMNIFGWWGALMVFVKNILIKSCFIVESWKWNNKKWMEERIDFISVRWQGISLNGINSEGLIIRLPVSYRIWLVSHRWIDACMY